MIVKYCDKNNKKVRININNLGFPKCGTEGIIFNYNDMALKIYYEDVDNSKRLDENLVKLLSQIDTKRILLPMAPIYTIRNKFRGYIANPFISNTEEIIKINNLNSSKILYELDLIYKDIDTLSQNKIAVYDLDDNYGNIVYNGDIYFIDPGKFLLDKNYGLKSYNISHINKALFNNLILLQENPKYLDESHKQIFENYFGKFNDKNYSLSKELLYSLYSDYYNYIILNSSYEKFSDYIECMFNKCKNLNGIKAQIIKEAIDKKSLLLKEENKQLIKSIFR